MPSSATQSRDDRAVSAIRESDAGIRPGILILLTVLVIAAAGVFAFNQKYLLDWDACFRAFTGLAARDIVVGLVTGDVRSRADVLRILTHYSDYFEARPGALISYPPGQTAVIAALSLISSNQWFLCLWNVLCFVLLSLGIARLCRFARIPPAASLVVWCIVCLHPTIVLTVWSLRRGLFEAALVVWFCVRAYEFLTRPAWHRFLDLVLLAASGFLYRETLALLFPIVVVLAGLRFRSFRPQWSGSRFRLAVAILLCAAATTFSAGQVWLAATGRLSMFSKISSNVRPAEAVPLPPGILTIWGYYRGQFGPQEYLGLTEKELDAINAPAVYRLARARWRLPIAGKAVYVASSVFANPASLLLLLLGLFARPARAAFRENRRVLAVPAAISVVWFLFLCPLGGIPDYVTPILPGIALTAGIFVGATGGRRFRRFLVSGSVAAAAATAVYTWIGFASGRFEEYPPQYDYDAVARRLLAMEPERPFGVAVSNYLVKNLAWSKLRVDPQNRMACYSLLGGRLPLSAVAGKVVFDRYSPILDYHRPAPGVIWFALRGPGDLRRAGDVLRQIGMPRPWWDEKRTCVVSAPKPLFGRFRPLELRRLRVPERPKQGIWPDTWGKPGPARKRVPGPAPSRPGS